MNIDNIDLNKKYKQLNNGSYNTGGNVYINDELILKIFDDATRCYTDYRDKFFDYLLKQKEIINSSYPKFKLYKKNIFVGYAAKYFKESKTFRKLMDKNISLDEKIRIIKDICEQLKQYHKYGVIIGDIHLDNMLGDKNGHLIDIDNSIIDGIPDIYNQLYTIKREGKSFTTFKTMNIDSIKSIICFLSLIFNVSFESKRVDLEQLLNILSNYLSNKSINFLKELFNNENVLMYFDEILDEFKDEEKILHDSNEIKNLMKKRTLN